MAGPHPPLPVGPRVHVSPRRLALNFSHYGFYNQLLGLIERLEIALPTTNFSLKSNVRSVIILYQRKPNGHGFPFTNGKPTSNGRSEKSPYLPIRQRGFPLGVSVGLTDSYSRWNSVSFR